MRLRGAYWRWKVKAAVKQALETDWPCGRFYEFHLLPETYPMFLLDDSEIPLRSNPVPRLIVDEQDLAHYHRDPVVCLVEVTNRLCLHIMRSGYAVENDILMHRAELAQHGEIGPMDAVQIITSYAEWMELMDGVKKADTAPKDNKR